MGKRHHPWTPARTIPDGLECDRNEDSLMRELLEAVAAGEVSPAEAEAELAGYVTGESGRFDVDRDSRRGIPETILASGKRPEQIVDLAVTSVEAIDRALITRVDEEAAVRSGITDRLPAVTIESWGRALHVKGSSYESPSLAARVAVVTGGTADADVAAEAALVCADAGLSLDRLEDVGVASLVRLLDQVDRIRDADVVIVAAGREASLPTVVAGLVDSPVIGVPVSSGYGHWGDGRAALASMLQSCTVLSVVNVDAGYVAGAQATMICRGIAAARTD